MTACDLGDEAFRLCVGEDIVDDCILLTLAGEDLGDESVSFSTESHSVTFMLRVEQSIPTTKTMQVDKVGRANLV